MRIPLPYITVFLVVCFSSCMKNKRKEDAVKFPSNPEYQCFLLDKDNKVLLVGNPALVSGIWILYKRVINERETKVLTMEKGGEFTSIPENNSSAPLSPKKKGGRKSTKLI